MGTGRWLARYYNDKMDRGNAVMSISRTRAATLSTLHAINERLAVAVAELSACRVVPGLRPDNTTSTAPGVMTMTVVVFLGIA